MILGFLLSIVLFQFFDVQPSPLHNGNIFNYSIRLSVWLKSSLELFQSLWFPPYCFPTYVCGCCCWCCGNYHMQLLLRMLWQLPLLLLLIVLLLLLLLSPLTYYLLLLLHMLQCSKNQVVKLFSVQWNTGLGYGDFANRHPREDLVFQHNNMVINDVMAYCTCYIYQLLCISTNIFFTYHQGITTRWRMLHDAPNI